MLEIRSTKYARQLNLTFFGKRYEDVPDPTRLEREGHKKRINVGPPAAPYMPQAPSPNPCSPIASPLSCHVNPTLLQVQRSAFFPPTAQRTPPKTGLIVAIDWGIRNSSPPDNAACVAFGLRVTVFPSQLFRCVRSGRERDN